MLKTFVILICLATIGQSADRQTFKTCQRVNFCSTLRSRYIQHQYQADANSFNVNANGVLNFLLEPIDGESDHLSVNLTRLEDNTFRLQILEVGGERYQLQDVLVGDPQQVPFDELNTGDGYHSVTAGDYTVKITHDPLKIEYYLLDSLQLDMDGSRLIFNKSLGQAFAFDTTFPLASYLYGIHEHAETLHLQTTETGGHDPYRLRNLDVAGFELNSPMALYGSVPVLYGHGPNSTTGLFLHNAAEHWYEVTHRWTHTHAYIMVESGAFDVFIFMGPSPTEVVRQYVKLTGTAHLPQLWALGYHQSRWNYVDQDDVKEVVARFTSNDFPLDAIWLDIDYTNGKRYFTWDSNAFSDPVEMQQNISAANKKLVTIIDPHIKVDRSYSVYDGALQQDLFVKKPDGSNFEGDCWPGLSSYIDFLNPAAQEYYANLHSYENFPSSTPVLAGIWNDMNEPSVFDNSIEKTLPGDAVHYGGVSHRDVHNIYGFLHTKSTHQGLISRDNGTKRPFVLTRSHFAGSQRYAAIWTGDTQAHWGYLKTSVSECLNANILGIVFCGADVGGFSSDPTEELLQRWYQAGAWLPFYRAHSESSTRRREPYLFSDEVKEVIRNAIQTRYQHLPVWYTLFFEHTRTGDPIIRPFFYHYPSERATFTLDDHILVGRDILVRTISDAEVTSVWTYFPGGSDEIWLSTYNSDVFDGTGNYQIPVEIEDIPVYYRRGSIIVRKDTIRLSTDEMANDGYTLYINLNSDNRATGTVYLDDNTSFNYVNNKEYNYLRIEANGEDVTLTKIDDDANSEDFDFVIANAVVNTLESKPQNGQPGRYLRKVSKATKDGQLLKNLRFNTKKSVTFQLALE